MAADSRLLQGELDSDIQWSELEVEQLMIGFMRSLIREQKGNQTAHSEQTVNSEQAVNNEC